MRHKTWILGGSIAVLLCAMPILITAGGCAHHILIGHARETSLDKKTVKALHGKPVVVLPVQNEISQDSPAMDLLSVQMEARGGFHVLPIESTRAAMLDHGITPGEPFTDDQALSVARAVHADGVVISEYGDDAMKVRLLEAGQGGTIWQTRATVEMSAREFDDAAMMDVLASAAGKSLAGKKHIRIVKKTRMETRDSAGRIVMSVMWTILGLLLVVPLFAV